MPELPEVETVCRGLRTKLLKRRIDSITYHRPNLRFVLPKKLPSLARGQRISNITRVSKYILIHLEKGDQILIHLGMSGRLFFQDSDTYKRDKHDHVVLAFDRGPLLIFNDTRRFGVLDYIAVGKSHKLLDNVGIDPFDEALTPAWLHTQCTRRVIDIKAFLMNQKIIAGLGNIYISEALFSAAIKPTRIAKTVTLAECKKLVPAIRKVLEASLKAGGSSLRDYVQTDGELGFFQNKFKVYGREDMTCPRCKTEIVKITQAGRSTYFCSSCQS